LCTYKNGLVKAHAARIQTQVRVMTLDVARLKRRDDDGAAKMVFNCLASTMVSKESVQDTVHDLRQPMQALRLSLRQMLDPDANNSKDAGQIESALAYMERLVAERLVDRAQHEPASIGTDQSALPVDNVQTNEPTMHDVLRGVVDMFSGEADAKGLALKLILAAPDAPVAAYPFMRIVANLVSNAIKYTPQGRIIVGLRRYRAGHRVDVHDTGPGLTGNQFQQALQRNERLDRDRNAADGSGLGLSMVKQIVADNDWRIASSEKRRTGASISVFIVANTTAQSS
jgi:two-component system, sensor histidine kinase LadS